MKKLLLNVLAAVCALLALLFIVVPGPSIVFLLAGLLCLSFNYSWARGYLKKTQTGFKRICMQLDKRLR
ncbi:PGPGW domain-containing protein [Pseudoalteromonas ardens]|uniref:PGPGW domain-containing protein n=1 Tax=Pseudoalteromonas ardens TaxID=3048490 RepID=UPI0009E2E1E5|nr:PGPGW domain-containing protein [Pseudoalteromonas sp. R96]MDK1310048.1 PGPGW domain-containing protein [Pseudoalteromonas sp. R96]